LIESAIGIGRRVASIAVVEKCVGDGSPCGPRDVYKDTLVFSIAAEIGIRSAEAKKEMEQRIRTVSFTSERTFN
jgi:hypothetical protein